MTSEYEGSERRQFDPLVLGTRLDSLHSDVQDIKSALTHLTSAITKLAIVEERQQSHAEGQQRAFDAISQLQVDVASLKRDFAEMKATGALTKVESSRNTVWLDKLIWAIISFGVGITFMWITGGPSS